MEQAACVGSSPNWAGEGNSKASGMQGHLSCSDFAEASCVSEGSEGKGLIAGDDRVGNHLIEASLKAGGLQGQSHLSPLVISQDVQTK